MRKPTEYETYLRRMRKYYDIKGIQQPEWLEKAERYYSRLCGSAKYFDELCSNTAIPKSTMNDLSSLKPESLEGLPEELRQGGIHVDSILKEMYLELISAKELYFVNEWTLSKMGRKKMREFIYRIPSGRTIMPPVNEFTNVPELISFYDGINSLQSEHELSVALSGSVIHIRNGKWGGGETIFLEFTERFLDEIIPLAQWERLRCLFHERDRSKDTDTAVQDFNTLHVEADKHECVLHLLSVSADNPFMAILRLVWEEYGDRLVERNLVFPWFDILGWRAETASP